MKQYSISELASEFDVTTRTIRFYEEKGLLKPGRAGQRRIYSPADRTRLRLILRGKRLGFSLEESAEIIGMYGASGNNRRQLETLLARIAARKDELERQRRDLDTMMTELAQAERNCHDALAQLASRSDLESRS